MILAELFEKITPRLGEGGVYGWQCFGSDAWCIDIDRHISMVYDTNTQLVYQITFYDYEEDNPFDEPQPAYVWTDSKFKRKYLSERDRRNIHDDLFTEVYINMKEIIQRIEEYQNG